MLIAAQSAVETPDLRKESGRLSRYASQRISQFLGCDFVTESSTLASQIAQLNRQLLPASPSTKSCQRATPLNIEFGPGQRLLRRVGRRRQNFQSLALPPAPGRNDPSRRGRWGVGSMPRARARKNFQSSTLPPAPERIVPSINGRWGWPLRSRL